MPSFQLFYGHFTIDVCQVSNYFMVFMMAIIIHIDRDFSHLWLINVVVVVCLFVWLFVVVCLLTSYLMRGRLCSSVVNVVTRV